MNPRVRAILRAAILLAVVVVLLLVFPKATAAADMAARELRYLWWLVLLVGLAVWLIWGFKKKP